MFLKFLKKRFLPFLEWLPELKKKEIIKADIIAWITVALVLIPQSMAYASLAWLPAHYWLYASFLPVMISAIWWSSKQLATWPITIASLLTAASLQPIAVSWSEWYIIYASFLALLVWIIQLSIWLLKLWKLVDFLSHSVVSAFINATLLIALWTQLSKLFWLKFWETLSTWVILEKWTHQYKEIINVLSASLTDTNFATLTMWLWSLILLLLLKKFAPKIPNVLFVVFWATIISKFIWYENMWEKLVIWDVPSWLPWFQIPFSQGVSLELAETLFISALTIAIVWFAEWISVAKSIAAKTKESVSANQELIWQWFANIVSSFFKWYAVAGSLSRSAINFSSGAKTWFSSVITGIVVALFLLFFTKTLYHLPQATLAAIIIFAVIWIVRFDTMIKSWKLEKQEWFIAFTTFFVTFFSAPNLQNWLLVWVFLSLAFYIYRSMSPSFKEVALYKDGTFRDVERYNLEKSPNVWVYKFDWNLYFANCWYFAWKLTKFVKAKPNIKLLVLDFSWVDEVDYSWIEILENLLENFRKSWIIVFFAQLRADPARKFKKSLFMEKLWKENLFRKVKSWAILYAKNTLKMDINVKTFLEYSPLPEKVKEEESIYKKLIWNIL